MFDSNNLILKKFTGICTEEFRKKKRKKVRKVEEKCKKCVLEHKNTINLIEKYKHELRNKPNTIQIVSLAFSCFALGLSIAKLLIT